MYTDTENDWITYDNINRYKSNIKNYLAKDVQSKRANENAYVWIPENCPLYMITGLISSARLQQKPIVYYGETRVTTNAN